MADLFACDVQRDAVFADLPTLMSALRHPDPHRRSVAAEAIAWMFRRQGAHPEDPDLVALVHADLAELWQRETADEVLSSVANALAFVGRPGALELLRSAVDHPLRMTRGQSRWGVQYLERQQTGLDAAPAWMALQVSSDLEKYGESSLSDIVEVLAGMFPHEPLAHIVTAAERSLDQLGDDIVVLEQAVDGEDDQEVQVAPDDRTQLLADLATIAGQDQTGPQSVAHVIRRR